MKQLFGRSTNRPRTSGSLPVVARSRGVAALLLFVLVVALLPGSLVASAETDLEKAEREAAEAQAAQLAAEGSYTGYRSEATDLQLRLIVTLEEYRKVNADLEQLGLQLANVHSDMNLTRGEIITLDKETQERAVEAYIRGVAAPGNSMFLSGSFESISVATEGIRRASDQDELLFQKLEDRRAALADLTLELESVVEDMADRDEELAVKTAELEELFAMADQRVANAYRNLQAADAAYLAAQTELEKEQAKRRWTGNVEQWRPLVEKYFPPERVDEAMRVMWCESGGNPEAKNPASTATGLFQFLDGTWAWMSVMSGWDGYSRLDPEANVAVAAYLVDYSIRTNHPYGTWGHWECQP